ncbi:MAG TPA: IS200/IS605 family transposase [Ktedonobacterales bacterium]
MTDEHVYYHVVFTVTYGKPVFLVPEVDAAFKDLVRELSHKQGWLLIELETMPNHVHLLIEKAPWEDPRQIIKAVKAFTARRLFAQFDWLRRDLSLSTSGLPAPGTNATPTRH